MNDFKIRFFRLFEQTSARGTTCFSRRLIFGKPACRAHFLGSRLYDHEEADRTRRMPGVRQGFCTARDKATYGSIKVPLEPSPSRVARRGGLALQKWRAIPYGG